MIGPPEAIAQAVLAHDPLAVALTILHIEWMTQRHYLDSVKDDQSLDPQFKSLLKHHWMEEAQHAKLDTLMVEALAEGRSAREIEAAVEEYLEIGGLIDAGLKQQVGFDLDAFTRATGRELNEEEKDQFRPDAASGESLDVSRLGHDPRTGSRDAGEPQPGGEEAH